MTMQKKRSGFYRRPQKNGLVKVPRQRPQPASNGQETPGIGLQPLEPRLLLSASLYDTQNLLQPTGAEQAEVVAQAVGDQTFGIDVSRFQGTINWTSVLNDGIDFVWAKATEGVNFVDVNWVQNVTGADAAGLLVSGYHFATPFTSGVDDAAAEATDFYNAVAPYLGDGFLRPALDLERGDALSTTVLSNWVHDFMNTFSSLSGGIVPIIYVNTNYATNELNSSVNIYDLWLANWTHDPNNPPAGDADGVWNGYDLWQYSDSTSVAGITGNVDGDMFFGNLAEFSAKYVIGSTSAIPSAPTGLAATPGDGSVSLNWDDNTEPDLSGYNVYRSTTSGGPYTQLNGSLVLTSDFVDNTAVNGTQYFYAVTAVDVDINESTNSAEVTATPSATAAPAAPTGLIATAFDSSVVLDWADNTEPDFSGYNVYRATTSGGPYTQLNGALLTTSDFTDLTTINDTTYFYVVTAVDIDTNESVNSAEVTATPSDLLEIIGDNDEGAPVYTETGTWSLSASSGYNGGTYKFASTGAAATAIWTLDIPATAPAEVFVQYRASTNRATNAQFIVAHAGGNTTVSVNQQLNNLVWVSLGTFNFNAGAATVTLDAATSTGGDVVIADAVRYVVDLPVAQSEVPLAPAGLVATPGDGSVSLNWSDNTEPDLSGYNVYRSTTSGGPYTQLNGPLVATSDYVDNTAVNDTQYFYVVTAVDIDTNESANSSEVTATPMGAPSFAFDFGTSSSPLAAGFTRIVKNTAYSADQGFGWQSTKKFFDRDTGTGTDLQRDFGEMRSGTFAVDLANGSYDVTITVGDADETRTTMEYSLEGNLMATVTTLPGEYAVQTFNATVSDGQLNLFIEKGGSDAVINGLEIVPAGAGFASTSQSMALASDGAATNSLSTTGLTANGAPDAGTLAVLLGYSSPGVSTAITHSVKPLLSLWEDAGDDEELAWCRSSVCE